MCLGSTPKVETPAPTPTYEEAKTDDVVIARKDERKRLKNAMNTRRTILDEGGSGGYKTLLGM